MNRSTDAHYKMGNVDMYINFLGGYSLVDLHPLSERIPIVSFD